MVTSKRAIEWPKEILRWFFKEFWLALITLLVLAFAFIVIRTGASEFDIRLTGLLLQWLGLFTVVIGIRKTRKLFGRPSLMQQLKESVSRLPPWRRDAFVHVGTLEAKATLGSVIAYGRGSVGPAASVEDQLKSLAQDIERLDNRLVQIQKETEAEWRKHFESLQQEKPIREKHDKDLRQLVEDAAAGGLNVSIMGVVWLFMGLFLSALPSEIALWIR